MSAAETLQDRLDALALTIGHGLSIDSPDGRLIAYSAKNESADPARIASILSRKVAPEIQAWQNQHGIAEATEPVEVPANPELGMGARLCVPVRQGHRCLGYLWVLLQSDTALSDTAIADVTRFARGIAATIDQRLATRSPAGHDVNALIRLLLGETATVETLDDLAAAMPTLLDARFQMCVVVPATVERASASTFDSAEFRRLTTVLPAALRAHPDYVGAFVGATHAVVLVRYRSAGTVIGQINDVINHRGSATERVATVASSDPARFDLDGARAAYRQALAAAELAALDPALPNPLSWAELGPYRRLLRTQLPTSDTTLAALDDAGASAPMLLHTLETYLDLGGDARRTAAQLHVHRTSLYYRLGRIADLLDVDLHDGLTRLDLHLALKCRRLARRTLG